MKDRRDFLKKTSLLGVASLLPFGKILANGNVPNSLTGGCVLIPSETAGPFTLDLTSNNFYFRQDVRETKTGVQLNLRLKIIGLNNCDPMPNLRVNIWHCDKDGLYSGYSQSGNPGQAGLTYLRGYQLTDVNGEVEIITILPGWYSGRICHIHFQVYVSTTYAAISQLSFDIPTKNAIYAANSSLYSRGADPATFSSDNIFSDGYTHQLATLTPNATTGSYDSYLEVTIQGNGTVGIGNIEKENAKQVTLGQNFPNPFYSETTIPFNLIKPADLTLELWDLTGKKVATISRPNLSSGDHQIVINLEELGLAHGNYAYQLEVINVNGTYRTSKLMTAGK